MNIVYFTFSVFLSMSGVEGGLNPRFQFHAISSNNQHRTLKFGMPHLLVMRKNPIDFGWSKSKGGTWGAQPPFWVLLANMQTI